MALGHERVDVAALLRHHGVDAEVIDQQEIDGQPLAQFGLVAVVEAGVAQGLQQVIDGLGKHGVAPVGGDLPARRAYGCFSSGKSAGSMLRSPGCLRRCVLTSSLRR